MHRWDGVGWGGAITFHCSCTLTSCYAAARSSHCCSLKSCYAAARSSRCCTLTSCYAAARSSQCLCCAQMGWGEVGWGNNIQLQLHTDVMLRCCTFFSLLLTHVMLRCCTFISLLRTHVMLRCCTFISMFVLCTDGVGWGGVGQSRSIAVNRSENHHQNPASVSTTHVPSTISPR